jgi:hypothetical protein
VAPRSADRANVPAPERSASEPRRRCSPRLAGRAHRRAGARGRRVVKLQKDAHEAQARAAEGPAVQIPPEEHLMLPKNARRCKSVWSMQKIVSLGRVMERDDFRNETAANCASSPHEDSTNFQYDTPWNLDAARYGSTAGKLGSPKWLVGQIGRVIWMPEQQRKTMAIRADAE